MTQMDTLILSAPSKEGVCGGNDTVCQVFSTLPFQSGIVSGESPERSRESISH